MTKFIRAWCITTHEINEAEVSNELAERLLEQQKEFSDTSYTILDKPTGDVPIFYRKLGAIYAKQR